MIARDVIDAARFELKDEDQSQYRWPDARMFEYLNEAQKQVKKARPDVFLTDAGTITDIVTVTAVGDALTLGDEYLQTLKHHVCGQALSSEGSDAKDPERAQVYFAQFAVDLKSA